ncbi:hypothetical protein IV203_023724 [Nitzschia inconspicua]|uniref:Uncharacterized protein n=1 Tax=Nitzschia inconspicua TaxID=303405 RepID=A0A9K3PAZ3_9STRA|nr:hypothetical protein IV203_023724 [Nitzschia inconspicua]
MMSFCTVLGRSNDETDGCRKRSVTKIDGCGYESDSSLQHVPSPLTLHNNFMEMPLFPEDLKNRVLAETFAHSFSSSRAKQMKSFMDHMNYVRREKRQGFIKEALSVYINEKKLDKTDFDAVGETKHSAAMLSRNRFVVAQKSGENEIDDDGNFVSRNRFVVAQKSGENGIDDDGNPKKLQISNLSKTSKAWDDFPQSSVDVLKISDALDSCGPGISLKRTWVSAGNNTIPPGWYVREYRCYNKTCNARILVWAPTNDLSSAPAYSIIHGVREHKAHQPIDWLGWYTYRCGKNPKSAEWDTAKYPKKPGLPHLIELAVIEVLRVTPNIGPVDAARAIRDRSKMKKEKKKTMTTSTVSTTSLSAGTICWKPTRSSGPKWIRELARHLQQTGVLTGLGWNSHEPETNLIVLDSEEVPSNDRWKELHGASDRVHKTGKDPRGRNVVFSSIALLANAVWCENVGWEFAGVLMGHME